jgi:hypothetical protein
MRTYRVRPDSRLIQAGMSATVSMFRSLSKFWANARIAALPEGRPKSQKYINGLV